MANSSPVSGVTLEERQTFVSKWVSDVISDHWLDNLQAVKNWRKVAEILEPEKTREELVKYLDEFIEFDDRVLSVFVDELDDFDKVLGDRKYTPKFMPILEKLCYSDNSKIRAKTISILTTVGITYEIQNKHTQFLSLIKKLSIDNYHTSKSSAAALICRLFGSFPEKPKKEAFRILEDLMSKDIPSVTQTISQNLRNLLESSWDEFRDQVFSIVEQLCTSLHENVKVGAVSCLQAMASSVNKKALQQSNTKSELDQKMLPLLLELIKDPSWRVRFSVCSHIKSCCDSFKKEEVANELINAYKELLTDEVEIVRIEALKRVASFAPYLTQDQLSQQLITLFQNIAEKGTIESRRALAHSTVEFCPNSRKPQSIINGKVTMFKVFFLLIGENGDAECYLTLLDRLDYLPQTISLESLQSELQQAMGKVVEHPDWKLRIQVPKYFAYLSNKLGEAFMNGATAKAAFMKLLEDPIFCVREETLNSLKLISAALEKSWMEAHLLEFLEPFLKPQTDHMLKMNFFIGVQKLAKSLTAELSKKLLMLTMEHFEDPLPNIRVGIVAALGALLTQTKEKKARDDIKSWIAEKKESEPDHDVRDSLALLFEEAKN